MFHHPPCPRVDGAHDLRDRSRFTIRRGMALVLVAAVDLALLRVDPILGAWAGSMTVLIGLAAFTARKRASAAKRRENPLSRLAAFLVLLVLAIVVSVGGTLALAWMAMRVAFR
jgi:hypothetical protein